jgi:phosphoglycerate dehydrogenase-like enzyme
MKVLFLGRFAGSHAPRIVARLTTAPDTEILADDTDRARLAPALAEADAVVGLEWRAGFPPAPHLKLLQCIATGVDRMDLAAVPHGVTVCNTLGHETPIAEYVIMTMLNLTHQLFHSVLSFRAGSWKASLQGGGTRHGELLGQTVGIVGYGGIGREVARRAAPFGVRLLAANRSPVDDAAPVERVYPLAELDRMLPECDVVVIACALAPETKGLIDARRIALMKPGACLINIARGQVVDEEALYTALRDGRLGGAAIDVWWRYPTPAEPQARPSRFPFHELPNVLMTPHSSSFTEGTAERRFAAIIGNIDRLARGEPLINVVTTV